MQLLNLFNISISSQSFGKAFSKGFFAVKMSNGFLFILLLLLFGSLNMISLKRFASNRHAIGIGGIVMAILAIVILATLVSNVLPDSIAQMSTTANWTDAGVPATSPVIPMFTIILPIVIAVVVIMLAVALVKKSRS